jgi:hypothetical protein
VSSFPNLVVGLSLGKPGEGPGKAGARLLDDVGHRGWPAGYLGSDRGYTQCLPEEFHLPARALGYSLVMGYKGTELGRQAASQGAAMVEGASYCPATPEDLVQASADKRAGRLREETYKARISAANPDIGARHRQGLAFGSEEWARAYATYRNTVEGWNGYVKDPAHEALAEPGRRRARGIAAQSLFVTLQFMAVAVGTALAGGPPHRSQRAGLPHWAPA